MGINILLTLIPLNFFLSLYFILIMYFEKDHQNFRMFKLGLSILILGACAALDTRAEFESFKALHGKKYTSLNEEEKRFQYFKENLVKIERHNIEGHSWKLGITKFADLPK